MKTIKDKINELIDAGDISDKVIKLICEKVDYYSAFKSMMQFDGYTFHAMFSEGNTYQSIFCHFIKNMRLFRAQYRDAIFDLMIENLREI